MSNTHNVAKGGGGSVVAVTETSPKHGIKSYCIGGCFFITLVKYLNCE